MLGAEPRDLLVAFPVIGAPKLRRLAELARITQVSVALDSLIAARQLADAGAKASVRFGVLVEVDAGLGRVGVAPTEVLDLVRAIAALPNLEWRGIAFYPGGQNDDARVATLTRTIGTLCHDLERVGFAPEIVSGGSTPLLFHSHQIEGVNEIRPGTYIFNDMNTVASGVCAPEDCAASILVTVVSHTRSDRIIVDGGSKTFSSDTLSSGGTGFGRLMEAPEAAFHRLNEEHGFIDLSGAQRTFEIGEKLRIVPNHICVAVNLHECIHGIRGENVESVWKVEGRGKLQ